MNKLKRYTEHAVFNEETSTITAALKEDKHGEYARFVDFPQWVNVNKRMPIWKEPESLRANQTGIATRLEQDANRYVCLLMCKWGSYYREIKILDKDNTFITGDKVVYWLDEPVRNYPVELDSK